MAEERLGASFSIDVTQLKAGLAQANRLIRESESEFKAAAAGMEDWRDSSDGLNAKIKSLNQITDVQKAKVTALQSEYDRLIADGMDPASKEAVELRTKINNETAALNKNEAELKKQKEALENFGNEAEEAGEATEEMGEGFKGLQAAGGIAVKAIAAVGAACVSAVTAFFGLAESTREARNNMEKLETSFEQVGMTAEDAADTYTRLYGVLGDDGKVTEAMSHLAQFEDSMEGMDAWVDIATGVYARFGDSLPIESLAEAANETAKTGQLTGALADALNWAGVSEEDFQKKLDKAKTESERAYLITEQLTDSYYDQAEAFRENNAEIIAAQEAQSEMNAAMNELGAIAEPIMTTLKQMATDLLGSITPFVAMMGEGLAGALSGADGAAESLAAGLSGLLDTLLNKVVELVPFLVETLSAVVPQLLSSLVGQLPTILQTLLQLIKEVVPQLLSSLMGQLPTILKTLMDMVAQITTALGEMLPTLIPLVINTVLQLVETLLDNIDMLIDAGIALLMGLADGLITALPQLIDKLPVIIDKVVKAITNNLPKLIQAGIQLTVKLAAGIIQAIPQLVSKIPQIVTSIVNGLKKGISDITKIGGDIIRGLWDGINNMASWIGQKIKGFGQNVLKGLKDFFGIHSPSRVMADEVGKNLALGIGMGFEDNIAGVNKQITGAMNFDGSVSAAGGAGIRAGGAVVNQYNYYSQAHSRVELYKTKQATAAAVRLAMQGA